MKCKRDTDARSIDHHTLQVMRQQAVKAAQKGISAKEIAASFGINVRSVYRWLADFANGGQTALLAKEIPGRPPKINAEQLKWLANALKDTTPLQYKFEFGLWTLALVGELLQREQGVKLSLSGLSRVMKLIGFTVQKPLYQAWQQDAKLVSHWENELYPQIRAKAKATGAEIYFADESGMRSDYHVGTTWAPKGETPVVGVTGRRFSINMISAVSPRGHFRFMLNEGTVTADVFIVFLKRLLDGARQPVFLIVDGHPTHRSVKVKKFVEEQNGRLELFFLPPYSPQLNPDEQVWAHVKRQVSKRLIQSKEEMKSMALGALRRIQKLPKLVKSFFRQPECQYAQL